MESDMHTKTATEIFARAAQAQGWVYSPWYQEGGWIHNDIRDNDGYLRIYDTAEEVCRCFDIPVDFNS